MTEDRKRMDLWTIYSLLSYEYETIKKKIVIIPSQFKYPSHKKITYRINKILRLKRAKVAWSCLISFKVLESHMLWLHFMSDFFHD